MGRMPLVAASANFGWAFLAGLISFLSPCVLPLVPGYLSLMTGVSVADLKEGAAARRVIPPTLAFVAGFTAVFVVLGATASSLGAFLAEHRVTFNRISGGVVIALGAFLLTGMVFRVPFLFQEARFHPAVADMGLFAAPVMGAAFAFGWTPCIGPVLGAVLTLSTTEGHVAKGMALLAVYSLGLGIPFLATSLALGKLTSVMRWFARHGRLVTGVSAAVLIVFGAMIFTGKLTMVSGWFTRLFESIGLDRLARI
jgi:cytochrome c-type biogenesis protein